MAKFEFGIGDDNAPLAGIGTGLAVDLDAQIPDPFSHVASDNVSGLVEGDVLVVPGLCLGGGSEDGLGQFGGFLKTFGQAKPSTSSEWPKWIPRIIVSLSRRR